MASETIKRFIELTKEKRELKLKLEDIESELTLIGQDVIHQWERDGTTQVKMDGMTVYVDTKIWARAKDDDRATACEALKAAGLGHFVQPTFNVNTLSAYVRELRKTGEEIPEILRENLEIDESFRLAARKG